MGPVINQTAPTTSSKSRSLRAALALVVLAPLIGEVLSGATRISFVFVFVPEMMVWGCGTLIIRELVRRWNGGWNSILLLGLGLSIAEEFVIQQTSLAPLPWPPSAQTMVVLVESTGYFSSSCSDTNVSGSRFYPYNWLN